MAKDDSESRRQRLREMRDQRLRRPGESGGSAGDDERIDRALAERRRSTDEAGTRTGERPLERFPRLRDALAQRRRSQGGGDREAPQGGRRRGDSPAQGQGGDRVMFARRLRDVASAEGGDDIGLKLERLERRMETLRAELARSTEELDRLKSAQREGQAGEQSSPGTSGTPGSPQAERDDSESLSAWLKPEGDSE